MVLLLDGRKCEEFCACARALELAREGGKKGRKERRKEGGLEGEREDVPLDLFLLSVGGGLHLAEVVFRLQQALAREGGREEGTGV